jgi:putative ABC transport system permease protein
MILALPLAWLQLSKEKLRLLVAVAGVAFAVILIFMQLGFRNALFDSSTRLHEALAGELFLVSPQFDFVAQPKSFSRRRLFQALAFPGVEAVRPLYLGLALWKNPDTGKSRTIFAVGVDPSDNAVSLPGVNEQLGLIRKRDVVLYDRAGRPEFGSVAAPVDAGQPFSTEVNNRKVTVGGLFEMGTSFGVDGTVLTSESNFLRLFPARERGVIDIGVISLQAGADPVATRDALRAAFPNDVQVLTRGEYIRREQVYWDTSTPIGYVFTFGVIMGLVVGAIIVYQILFADVSDHLAEYATLKAMGYPNTYLFGVVFQEAIILAVLGYLPGMVISLGLYRLTADATKLPMQMTVPLAVAVVLLAVIMCCVSGAIALRKIRSADPAEIF